MAVKLQDLNLVNSKVGSSIMLIKDSRNGSPEDHQILVNDFLADRVQTSQITTTPEDSTSDKLLKTGDFGLATDGLVSRVRPTDCNQAVVSGIYQVSGTATNRPSDAGSDAGYLEVLSWESSTVQKLQKFTSVVSGESWFRIRNSAGTWLGWDRVVRDSDITDTDTDTTVGKILKVGDFGVGVTKILTETDLNAGSYLQSGFYLSPASGLTNLPTGYTQSSRVLVIVNGSSNSYVQQILTDYAGVTYTRYASVGSIGSYSWKKILNEADITSSTTDTTVGKLLKVGDFGLGVPSGTITDANSLTATGFFSTPDTWTGSPIASTSQFNQGYLLNHAWSSASSNYILQVFYNINGSVYASKARRKDNGVWGDWYNVYTSRNSIGTVSQSGGVPTGAIIERGSNANGEYVKYADGTLICTDVVITDRTTAPNVKRNNVLNPAATFVGTPTEYRNLEFFSQTGATGLACYTFKTQTGRFVNSGEIGSSEFTWPPVIGANSALSDKQTLIAIGRWF